MTESFVSALFHDMLAFVLPTRCVVCGRDNRTLCHVCRRDLARSCREPPGVRRELKNGVPCVSALPYRGPVRRVLTAVKHGDRPGLARELAPALRHTLARAAREARHAPATGSALPTVRSGGVARTGSTVRAGGAAQTGSTARASPTVPTVPTVRAGVTVVPVPSRPWKTWRRGYHHLAVLLRQAGVPRGAVQWALATSPGRRTQVGLTQRQRAQNAARLRVRRRVVRRLVRSGAPVVVCDDTLTTGASLTAATDALRRAGVRVVAAATLCYVPRERELLLRE